MIGAMTFFFCTLEEYYLERLDFPVINGVNEGALVSAIILIFTGFQKENFWLTNIKVLGFYLKYNTFVTYIFFMISFCFSIYRYFFLI